MRWCKLNQWVRGCHRSEVVQLCSSQASASILLTSALLIGCGGDGAVETGMSRPTITYVTPSNAAIGVATNAKVTVTFSERMDLSSLNKAIALSDTTSNLDVALQDVAFDDVNNIATVTPAAPLQGEQGYKLRVSTAATDLAGNKLAASYASTFSTSSVVDTDAPTVTSWAPLDGETGVGTNSAVAMSFSEPMDAAPVEAAMVLSDGAGAPVPGSMKYIGQAAAFKPAAPLLASKTYTVTMTSVAKDLAGNLLTAKSWIFATGSGLDTILSKIDSVVPVQNSKDVPPSTPLASTFDSAIYPFVFGIVDGVTAPVFIDYSTNTVTLALTVPLPSDTPFTTTITASDLAGNPTAYSWNFTTGR